MRINISLKTDARMAAKAHEKRLSIDAFLERLPDDAADLTPSSAVTEAPELLVRHLSVRGSLHRRDIYDSLR